MLTQLPRIPPCSRRAPPDLVALFCYALQYGCEFSPFKSRWRPKGRPDEVPLGEVVLPLLARTVLRANRSCAPSP
jgi:hypothetical protein